MSWPELHVQHHKRQTDCAIHHAFTRLASNPLALAAFRELLRRVRTRAPRLFEAPIIHERHAGVDALVNLARFHQHHIRAAIDWPGTARSWRPALSSLANHLVSRYNVPEFLVSAWHVSGPSADAQRFWFVAHARGASFRSLNLPIPMTRRMEHLFLASPDHLLVEQALRRAELLALGAPPAIIQAILATRLGNDLSNSEFWRTVWLFLIANTTDLDTDQIAPILDYLQTIRHERTTIEAPTGRIFVDPPQPHFSLKGRTLSSVLRLMRDWHRSLGSNAAPTLSWPPSSFQPWLFEEPTTDAAKLPRLWQMQELTDSAQLRSEGSALHHCVASYAYRCHRGTSSIWSLRFWRGNKLHHVLTVEIHAATRTIVQARGRGNRPPSDKAHALLANWATRERLRMIL